VLSTPDSEINALKQFYEDTRGDSWVHKDGWLTGMLKTNNKKVIFTHTFIGDPCAYPNWYGVNCSSTTSSVSELILTQNNLAGMCIIHFA
jgi:hypothetical protein